MKKERSFENQGRKVREQMATMLKGKLVYFYEGYPGFINWF